MQRPQTLPVLFTIDDLSRMIDAGVFNGRTGRIELIEGELRAVSPATERRETAAMLDYFGIPIFPP